MIGGGVNSDAKLSLPGPCPSLRCGLPPDMRQRREPSEHASEQVLRSGRGPCRSPRLQRRQRREQGGARGRGWGEPPRAPRTPDRGCLAAGRGLRAAWHISGPATDEVLVREVPT